MTPEISCDQAYLGRADWGISVKNGLGGATAYLAISSASGSGFQSGIPLNIDSSQILSVVPVTLGGTVGVAGAGSAFFPIPLAIPISSAFADIHFYAQVVVVDVASGGLASTGGLDVTLTMPPLIHGSASVGGSCDPNVFVDPSNGQVSNQSYCLNNVSAASARFANAGLDLYVASTLFDRIDHCDFRGATPTWSILANLSGRPIGIRVDKSRQWIWTLNAITGSQRELVAIDMNGVQQASTSGLAGGGLVEMWTLSQSGKRAAVSSVMGGNITIWDTDDTSPTFLQPIAYLSSPSSLGSSIRINTSLEFTTNDESLLVSIQNIGSMPGELARYSFSIGLWIDHDITTPVVDNAGPNSNPPIPFGSAPRGLSFGRDSNTVFVSGFGGNGWVSRLDYSPQNPYVFSGFTSATAVNDASRCSVNEDGTVLAVSSSAPKLLILMDAATLTVNQSIPVSMFPGHVGCITWR